MQTSNQTTRRDFLKAVSVTTIGGAALLSGCSSISSKQAVNSKNSIITKGSTVLFQGDSITDSGRSRGQGEGGRGGRGGGMGGMGGSPLGSGYVNFIAANLMAKLPTYSLNIQNRGISGNTVTDLAARWDADCLELKPNVLSILIGVNDIWHTFQGTYNGTIEKYNTGYRELLNRTIKALPEVKLVICEPYVLRYGTVNDTWFPEFDGYRASAKKIAQDFKAIFVPFQTMFDNAVKDTQPSYWSADGIHPSSAGAMLMANEWLKAVGV
jgi:lysophospholipase L1-like esterase